MVKSDPLLLEAMLPYTREEIEQAEILMSIRGYIEREKENADKLKDSKTIRLNRILIIGTLVVWEQKQRKSLKNLSPQPLVRPAEYPALTRPTFLCCWYT